VQKELIKLNLGCRNREILGFEGMDCDNHPGVKHVGDVGDLNRFGDNSVSEIYASHVLEHFSITETLDVLKEWRRVLSEGGILYVAVPDFKRCIEIYEKTGLDDWIVNYLWGDQGYDTAFHYAGFDEDRLGRLLVEAGFSEVSRVEEFPVGPEHDCSKNRSTLDKKNVSLNMVAIK
jgi:predicted SAM-dependent methyltransferase